jgi:hypothetical protein
MLALPATTHAGLPRAKAMFEAHRHNTGGHDWHVQLEVNKQQSRLVTVVVYSQLCGVTGFTQKVPLTKDGNYTLSNVPTADKKATWSLQGGFPDADHSEGMWSVTKGDCVDGGEFRAQDASGHFLIGNPYEYAPNGVYGESIEARRLRALKYHTRQNAKRFDTIAKARKQGYELSTTTGCPGMHHARKHGTAMWGDLLDPEAPQSLVYWCDSQKHWTLAAFMYRADGKSRPSTYKRMLQWHKHGPTASWMTHVWMVSDPRAAFATCAPFTAFQAAGIFTYEPYRVDTQVDTPCSDSYPPPTAAEPAEPGMTPPAR